MKFDHPKPKIKENMKSDINDDVSLKFDHQKPKINENMKSDISGDISMKFDHPDHVRYSRMAL